MQEAESCPDGAAPTLLVGSILAVCLGEVGAGGGGVWLSNFPVATIPIAATGKLPQWQL